MWYNYVFNGFFSYISVIECVGLCLYMCPSGIMCIMELGLSDTAKEILSYYKCGTEMVNMSRKCCDYFEFILNF